ncbi:MAG: ABC transporter permease [Cyanobacteria bacterium HKST-UBA02]|nr:ABC transporter permease [Cyanobacteria bacterium HKST-UBA02]
MYRYFLIPIFLALLFIVGCLISQSPDGLLVNLDAINLKPASPGHLLGTDSMGRDVFTIAALGSRTSLSIGFAAALLAVSFGTVWGALGAMAGRVVGSLMMRLVDAMLSVPSLILLLAFSALINRPEFTDHLPTFVEKLLGVSNYSLGLLPVVSVVSVIAATSWLEAARIAYSRISAIRNEEYIEAARSLGLGTFAILRRHLIPNARGLIFIQATLLVSDAIVMEAGLSFLGLGLGPSTPSWGSMLRQTEADIFFGNWWAPLVPAILISLTVLSVNMLGEKAMNTANSSSRQT